MWLDCSKLYEKEGIITQFFYEKAKLGLSDGKSFGYGGNGFMRLNFGASVSIIKQAMKQLIDAYNMEFKK
jgi:cystathionine beta-lyase